MSTIIYIDNRSGMPIGSKTDKDIDKTVYAGLVAPLLSNSAARFEKKTGAEFLGFDVTGAGQREIMFYMGKTLSAVYIGSDNREINPAYLRDTVRSLEDNLSLEKNRHIKEKIESGFMDEEVGEWLKKNGGFEVKDVMLRRTGEKNLGRFIVDVEKETISEEGKEITDKTSWEHRKLRPGDSELKGLYQGLKSAGKEAYEMLHKKEGKKAEKVDMIIKYHGKLRKISLGSD